MATLEFKANPKINLRHPDVMAAVQAQVETHYRSQLVDRIRAKGHVLSADGLTIKLAKEFGARFAAIADPARLAELKDALAGTRIECGAGESAVIEAAARPVRKPPSSCLRACVAPCMRRFNSLTSNLPVGIAHSPPENSQPS